MEEKPSPGEQPRYTNESFNSQQDYLWTGSTTKVCPEMLPPVSHEHGSHEKEGAEGLPAWRQHGSESQLPVVVPKMAISHLNKLSLFYLWAWRPCKWHDWPGLNRLALQHRSGCSPRCPPRLQPQGDTFPSAPDTGQSPPQVPGLHNEGVN